MILKYLMLLWSCLLTMTFVQAQNIERKIIIQNGQFIFQTIHEENQMATMHTGNINQPVSKAQKYALPFGRNYEEPFNPFVWDVSTHNLFALNFLRHPLNDWNQAIKILGFEDLQKDSFLQHAPPFDLLMKSVDYYMWAMNEPYMKIRSEHKFFDRFYYDAVFSEDSVLWMIYAIEDSWQLWNLKENKWRLIGEDDQNGFDNYFSLVNTSKYLLLFTDKQYWFIDKKDAKIRKKQILPADFKDYVLVIDRDNNKLFLLSSESLQTEIPFKKVLKTKGIPLANS